MAIRTQDRGPVRYVPTSERNLPEHEQTVIIMRKLSRAERAEINDDLIKIKGTQVTGLANASVQVRMVLAQLDGWQNVVRETSDGTAVPVTFDRSARERMFELLPEDIQDELEARFGSGRYVEETDEAAGEEAAAE